MLALIWVPFPPQFPPLPQPPPFLLRLFWDPLRHAGLLAALFFFDACGAHGQKTLLGKTPSSRFKNLGGGGADPTHPPPSETPPPHLLKGYPVLPLPLSLSLLGAAGYCWVLLAGCYLLLVGCCFLGAAGCCWVLLGAAWWFAIF